MRKGPKNFIVGLFIIIGITLAIFMYTWFSGRLVLRNTYDVLVYFKDVRGLRVGDPVMVYGLEKGRVKSLKIESGAVLTVLAIDRSLPLPKDSKIAIRSMSLVSSDKFVKVNPGDSSEIATTFIGSHDAFDIESLGSKLDSLFTSFEKLNMGDITKVAKGLSRNISKNVTRLVNMMQEPTTKMGDVIEKTEYVIVRLDSLTQIVKGDGTVGKLLKSDELYEEVRQTNTALKELLIDIKENPKRYLEIKVF